MLTYIHVSHFITLQKLDLECRSGTTTITGETGAGKSILIDAIEVALGGRATGEMVREGSEKADISLSFDVSTLPEAKAWLTSYELNTDTDECIIRRTITRDGRSRSYINDMPTTLQPLRELSALLINIHGQHEHHALLKEDTQRDMLDHYAAHSGLVDKVRLFSKEWHTLSQEIKTLRAHTEDRSARSEYLKFQLNELEALQLTPDEFQSLDLEHKQLANADVLLQNVNGALTLLADNEHHNVSRLLHQTIHHLEAIERVNPKLATWIESLKSAMIHVNDVEDELRHFLDSVDLDPTRLQWIEHRLTTLFDIARKHKVAPHELLALQHTLAEELRTLDTSDERIKELEKQLKITEKNYLETAEKLSQSRAKAAKQLAKEITQLIRELSLPHGEFSIHFEPEKTPFSADGLEKIIFHIKTNQGLSTQPLAKIASGGELSRISLAIHMATAEQHTIPTLIFDEVDVGIGGGTAEIVGKLLRRLGHTHQVICFTHLPQVAAQGHHHLRVSKHTEKNTTFTHLTYLDHTEKTHELARMLGGVEITQKTLAHAKEMMDNIL